MRIVSHLVSEDARLSKEVPKMITWISNGCETTGRRRKNIEMYPFWNKPHQSIPCVWYVIRRVRILAYSISIPHMSCNKDSPLSVKFT